MYTKKYIMKDLEEYLEALKQRERTYQTLAIAEINKTYWSGLLSATRTIIEELEPIVYELTKIEL